MSGPQPIRNWRALGENALATSALALVLLGILIARLDLQAFEGWYAAEGGPAESLTVLALVVASAISLGRLRRSAGWRDGGVALVVGMLLLLGAGEELSWGQRLLDFETPGFFQRYNDQSELNLHNLVIGGVKVNKLVFSQLLGLGAALYMLVLPGVYRLGARARGWVNGWGLPIPKFRHVVVFVAILGLVELIPSHERWEVLELGSCVVALLVVWRPRNAADLPHARLEKETLIGLG